jgi:drug/metabolite transporter (DMT)-like permease
VATGTQAGWGSRGGTGLALAVVSAATFGTAGTFGSSLIDAGWSPAAAVITRVAVAALVLTIPALLQLRGRWARLRRGAASAVAFGLVAVAGAQLCYFIAIQRIPVGVALLLEYLGAVLVVGWLWLRHGQRPRRLTLIGAVTAIAGLAMVLDLAGPVRLDPVGVMWALLAAVGLAIYFLLSAADEEPLPPIVMAWAGMCVGAAVLGALGWIGVLSITATAGPVAFLHHQVSWVVPVLGLSLLAAVVSYVAGIGAARRLGAKLASFIGMAEVLFAVLFAWLLLGQLPSAIQFLGGAFILAGVTLVRADELRPAPGAGSPDRTPDMPVSAGLSGPAADVERRGVGHPEPPVRAGQGTGGG